MITWRVLKGKIDHFELAGSSSFRGFELSAVNCTLYLPLWKQDKLWIYPDFFSGINETSWDTRYWLSRNGWSTASGKRNWKTWENLLPNTKFWPEGLPLKQIFDFRRRFPFKKLTTKKCTILALLLDQKKKPERCIAVEIWSRPVFGLW